MIKTVADFLLQLKNEESRKLSRMGVTHGPTIGEMYEGLSVELLGRSIPASLELQLASGFIIDGLGGESGQIDCMLVRGSGTPIPYTGKYKWHVKDVIAVLEIKKALLGSDLADAFNHLRRVKELESNHYATLRGRHEPLDISPAQSALAEITGVVAPSGPDDSTLPEQLRLIRHILILEQFGAIRVILGYDGFKTEAGLRRALISHLETNVRVHGFGPASLPQLVIAGDYSLVKATGQPYSIPLQDGWWPLCFSCRVNPLLLLLEFIWTRLARDYKIGGMWGDDLQIETAHALLLARPENRSGQLGWSYKYVDAKESELAVDENFEEWHPAVLSPEQFAVIRSLCGGHVVRIDDEELVSLATATGSTIDEFVVCMVETRLVALADGELELITERCQPAILPDGRFVAGEDNSGRMTRWLLQRYPALLANVDESSIPLPGPTSTTHDRSGLS